MPPRCLLADLTIDVEVDSADGIQAAIISAPSSTPYVIALTSDISLSSSLRIINGRNIVLIGLTGSGGEEMRGEKPEDFRQLTQTTADTPVITVENGGTLTLSGITVTQSTGVGVYIDKSGTMILDGGFIHKNGNGEYVAISNRDSNSGGGVYNAGTLIMNGGVISDNIASKSGGGVCNNGVFTMMGGIISRNVATLYLDPFYGMRMSGGRGGGVCNIGGTFIMAGGTITGNRAIGYLMYGGDGGGVWNDDTFLMTGGVISNNTADDSGGGVWSIRLFTMNGGVISDNEANNSGGGVMNGSRFVLEGGMILGNRANCYHLYSGGGGVCNSGYFTINGGTIVANEAKYGGGVYSDREFSMVGGEISGNRSENEGGGVYNSMRSFIMGGGAISGNAAGSDGGGVWNSGTFTMTGGIIADNSAARDGGGVYTATYSTFIAGNGDTDIIFSGNKAQAAYLLDTSSAFYTIYSTYIKHSPQIWTAPFEYGYNNYDINFSGGIIYPRPTNGTTTPPGTIIDCEVDDAELLQTAVDSAPQGKLYVIALTSDITSTSTLSIPSGKNIVLVGLIGPGGGYMIGDQPERYRQLIQICDVPTITVQSGGVMTLAGITVTHSVGNNPWGELVKAKDPGVYVEAGGILVLDSGFIYGNEGKGFSYGGGVLNNGNLVMNGGAISGNEAYSGGGVWNGGTFAMNGGVISGNEARDGGGVWNNGTFTMIGGEVIGNVVRGDSGLKYGGNGGGVGNTGKFIILGGVISGNYSYTEYGSTRDGYGGGYGGGIGNRYGTVTIDGGIISDNYADKSGGGVWNGGALLMSDGEISGNKAGGDGGGVCNINGNVMFSDDIISFINGTTTLTGGKIINNIAGGDGGGIYTTSHLVVSTTQSDTAIIFSGNIARVAYLIDLNSPDLTAYAAKIKHFPQTWSASFEHGYNNYDINYTGGTMYQPDTTTSHKPTSTLATSATIMNPGGESKGGAVLTVAFCVSGATLAVLVVVGVVARRRERAVDDELRHGF